MWGLFDSSQKPWSFVLLFTLVGSSCTYLFSPTGFKMWTMPPLSYPLSDPGGDLCIGSEDAVCRSLPGKRICENHAKDK